MKVGGRAGRRRKGWSGSRRFYIFSLGPRVLLLDTLLPVMLAQWPIELLLLPGVATGLALSLAAARAGLKVPQKMPYRSRWIIKKCTHYHARRRGTSNPLLPLF